MPPDLVSRRTHDRRLIRLIWPVSALLVLALALVAFPVVRAALDANDAARAMETETIEAVVRDRATEVRMAAMALAVVARDKGVRLADAPLTLNELSLGRASGFLLLEHGGRVMTQRLLDAPGSSSDPDIGLRLRVAALADPAGLAAGRFLAMGKSLVIAASAEAPGGGVLIAYRGIAPAGLASLGRRFGFDGLALATAPREGAVGVPVPGVEAGERAAFLVWQPHRPGDALHGRLAAPLALGLCLAALLFGTFVVAIRALAADLASSREQAENLVGRDPLSGLPNRQFFADRLDQELNRTARTGEGLAVLFLDLDRFKDVNDTFGHQAGDALLIEVAKRLGAVLRGEDTLARFGGDEFAVIQTRLEASGDSESLARRILDSLTQPFVLGGTAVTVGVSIGIALAPADGLERETLMRLADTALYQAKSGGRNRFCFFAREMDETIRMRKLVEDDLRRAIATDELVLHYQPIVSADGSQILGVEALVRWPHPEHGLISPAKFVPIAEERGFVIPLGEWVLRRACRDAARWPGVRLAVNVSALQFHHRDFVASVLRATDEAGFDPRQLEIELTEGVLVDDEDAAKAAMMELRDHGVNLALDDFGTGYSSLIYLRRFAFDKIKIDRYCQTALNIGFFRTLCGEDGVWRDAAHLRGFARGERYAPPPSSPRAGSPSRRPCRARRRSPRHPRRTSSGPDAMPGLSNPIPASSRPVRADACRSALAGPARPPAASIATLSLSQCSLPEADLQRGRRRCRPVSRPPLRAPARPPAPPRSRAGWGSRGPSGAASRDAGERRHAQAPRSHGAPAGPTRATRRRHRRVGLATRADLRHHDRRPRAARRHRPAPRSRRRERRLLAARSSQHRDRRP